MIYFLLLLVITIIMYLGYGAVVDLTENDVAQEEATDGKVLLLHKIIKNKKYYFRATILLRI